MVTGKSDKHLPPYVSYRTFRNFLERLRQGVPARIDRSYWGDKWSGSTGTQLMAAIRFLNLVTDDGMPSNRLRQLVFATGSQRAELLRQMASEAFSFILLGSLDCKTATYAQLEDAFREKYQIGSSVTRKCIKFFVELTKDAGIPLSPFVTKKSREAHTSTGTKKFSKRISSRTKENMPIPQAIEEVPGRIPLDKILMTKFPNLDPNWPDEVKLKWFDAFDQLLKRVLADNYDK